MKILTVDKKDLHGEQWRESSHDKVLFPISYAYHDRQLRARTVNEDVMSR